MAYLYLFLFVLAWRAFQRVYNPRHPLQLNVYFGVPGSGKTTFAAYLAKQAQKESIVIKACRRWPCWLTNRILSGKHWKRRMNVWSNVPINGCYRVDARKDIGNYLIEDGKLMSRRIVQPSL